MKFPTNLLANLSSKPFMRQLDRKRGLSSTKIGAELRLGEEAGNDFIH